MKFFCNYLHESPLFAGISKNCIPAMLGCLGARTLECKKGSAIISIGDRAENLGVVLNGKIQMVNLDYYGNRSIVAEMESSQVFGEVFACSDIAVMPVDIVASEDSSVLLLNARRITQVCTNACSFHRQIIFNLLKIVAAKGLMFGQKINVVSKRTTREKLLTYLGTVAEQEGDDTFTIPYNRQELADYLEVDRSGLSSEIGKMCKEGIIRCHRSNFTLLHNHPDGKGSED